MKLMVYLFLFLAILANFSYAGPIKKEWPILSDGNRSYLIGGMYVDDGQVGKELPLSKVGTQNLFDLLSTYYAMAKINNIAAIAQLHFEKDGSRKRFSNEISKIPDKFSGFKSVDKVVLGEIFYWGSYAAVSVEWYVKNKRMARWVELVHCENSCSLSNRLLHTNATFEAFSSFMSSYLRKSKQSIRLRGNEKISFHPAVGPSKKPIDLTYFIERYPDRVGIKNKGKDTALADLKDADDDVLIVARFIKSIWSNGSKVLDKLASDNKDNAKPLLSSLYDPFWHEFDLEEMIPMYDKSGEGANLYQWEAVYYTPLSLLQKISNWEEVTFFGFMQSKKIKYLFVTGIEKGGANFMQFFPVSSGGSNNKITASPDDPIVRSILMAPTFSGALSKEILN